MECILAQCQLTEYVSYDFLYMTSIHHSTWLVGKEMECTCSVRVSSDVFAEYFSSKKKTCSFEDVSSDFCIEYYRKKQKTKKN